MKNKLKEILLIVPMIVTLLLSCVPLVASAAEVSQVGDKYTVSLAEMQKENTGQYYLYYNYWVPWNDGYHSQVYYFYTDVEPTYEKSGNTYTISFTSSLYYSYYLLRDTGTAYEQKNGLTSLPKTITYNMDTHEVLYTGGSFGGFDQISKGANFIDFQTNMFSTEAFFDVDVSFRPPLSGVVNRTVHDQDGNEGLSQIFSMHVQNNSDKAIQYIMEIKEKDTDQLIYDYLTNEWVYSYDIKESSSYSKSMDFKGEHVVLQYKPAREHHVAAGAGDTQIFKFCQIPFEKDKEYIVTVRASLTNLDNASSIIFGAFDYQFTEEDYTEVYSSTFSISDMSGIAFDPTDTSNGVLPYGDSSDRSSLLNSRDALIKEDGSIDYKSYNSYKDPDSPYNRFGSSVGSGTGSFSSGKSSFSFSNLLASSSSFFAFLSATLGYFPSIILEAVSLSLVSILVFAIIRRLH